VRMLAFGLKGGGYREAGRVPGPVLRVRQNQAVTISVTNKRPEPHHFAITGVSLKIGSTPVSHLVIGPGATVEATLRSPQSGTFVYYDDSADAAFRILGLHGVLVVEPDIAQSRTPQGSRTPYSLAEVAAKNPLAAQNIGAVFDALGTPERFPGGKWNPALMEQESSIQEKIWIANTIDPRLNALITDSPLPASVAKSALAGFLPRYFTMNNRSGFDLHDDKEYDLPVVAKNYIGEPTLIRCVNVGVAYHSFHIHGNHVFDLARVDLYEGSPTYGQILHPDNIFEVDTWAMWPMQRRDMLLPYEVPPDMPYSVPLSTPKPGQAQFTRMVNRQAQEPFPLRYVMHCHTEMSQTAAGGNYPQGLVTHWEVHGGVGGRKTSLSSR
jgi:FtsP/CotA-like multicopper oxidase with cupredoxin domain